MNKEVALMTRTGIAAAPGIALGRAIVKATEEFHVNRKQLDKAQAAEEIERFKDSVQLSYNELEQIKEKARKDIGEEEAKIFEAHQMFLQDPEFIGAISEKIEQEQINAEAALEEVKQTFVVMFESMDNEYMRERAADLKDVSKRVLKNLLGVQDELASGFSEPVILVVNDLTPSDTAQLDREKVKGFVTQIGGRTSHSAIMARTMEIPAVVGVSNITSEIKTGELVIVNGLTGEVLVNPDENVVKSFEEKRLAYQKQKEEWAKLLHESSLTADGKRVELVANIGNPADALQAKQLGAEGIGLFRTEFLYMGRDSFPTEDEQFEAYKQVVQTMGAESPVVIRTLDIGGDKELSYLDLPKEMNPFLGFRAIRLCLDRTDLFKTQLRALLRASSFGNLKIMYPMISTLRELRQANKVLEEVKAELRAQSISFNEELEVGMMIEVPAAAMVADQLAKEADFFSIGTNDLIQYTMAADRMNQQVSYLYQPFNPALLRLIQRVIEAAHKEGKWVGMCGEMAGEETAVPILLGLGLDEFSMSATSVLRARHLLTQLDSNKAKEIAAKAINMDDPEEIKAFVQEQVFHA
jgi:phosphoenolpyruvate-protein phosphotransferase (PTS system enzyme I)